MLALSRKKNESIVINN
ncbi:MAG: carbon storage regulator, partial [Lachnospiraceae bacterium]|nr:carbon storage regulator [Lachnospiraceae bacterium]